MPKKTREELVAEAEKGNSDREAAGQRRLFEALYARPEYCCGVCPGIVGGGYDCTCRGNPRCPNYEGEEE